MNDAFLVILIVLLIIIITITLFFLKNKKNNAFNKVETIIFDANKKKDEIITLAQNKAKQIINEMQINAKKEIDEKQKTFFELEKKLLQRENNIEIRDNNCYEKEKIINIKQEKIDNELNKIKEQKEELQNKINLITIELEKIAKLNQKEAEQKILDVVKKKLDNEIIQYVKKRENEAKENANNIARKIIALAISRYSQDEITSHSTNFVSLPNDDVKGKIIGRDGRNIKMLERLLGVDILIDDTPLTITISSFNPLRREIAKTAIEYLIKDNHIQPNRIEEIVKKTILEINDRIYRYGQDAIFKLNILNIDNDLANYIGRLKFRTSYGQNVYDHSIDVAYLAGMMAVELGLDQSIAKRAGLLHDIGKAIDYEVDGTHVELGKKIAKKFNESDIIINAIASHHGNEEPKSVYAILVAAADTLSAARPGARDEMLETYIKRVEQLETICNSFAGVDKTYVLRAGKEIRVMVIPEQISDAEAFKLVHNLKEKIEKDAVYPGEININVIREFCVSETAK